MSVPDYPLEATLHFKFTTRAFATGAPTTLAGTPVVDIYEDDSLTQITAAETLTVDFDSVTGLNHLAVAATAANGFEAGKSYQAVITTGTVGGVSVVGEVVAQFSLERSPALRPTTAGRTLDVTATGAAGIDWGNVENATTAVDLSGTDIQLCDTVTTLTGHTAQTGDSFARLGAPAGASVSADVATANARLGGFTETGDNNVLGLLKAIMRNNVSVPNDVGGTYSPAEDSLEAVRNRGDIAWNGAVFWDTTIGTLSSQTSFTVSQGSGDDDAYNGALIVITDATNAFQQAVGLISDYDGATGTITLAADPGIFTMAAGDKIKILATSLASQSADAVWDEAQSAHSTAGTFGEVATETAAILADTADMQPKLGSPAGADMSADIAAIKAETAAIVADTNELQTDDVPGLIAALNDVAATDILTTALTEGYAADGAAFTLSEALYMIWSLLAERSIVTTTLTAKKLDGSTSAMTFTLDDATTPTSQTRAT